jgi:hypothetical protein
MANIYSARLLASAALLGVETVTVPAGEVWIVRDLDIVVTTPPTATQSVNAFISALCYLGAWPFTILMSYPVTVQWRGRAVLTAGDTLGFGTTLVASVAAHGYVLTAP